VTKRTGPFLSLIGQGNKTYDSMVYQACPSCQTKVAEWTPDGWLCLHCKSMVKEKHYAYFFRLKLMALNTATEIGFSRETAIEVIGMTAT
jgi:ribosomal protein L37AE/L43A